jgi:hypothetical protein
MLLSHGRALYSGAGGLGPTEYFSTRGVPALREGYNVADYLLEVASDAPVSLYQSGGNAHAHAGSARSGSTDEEAETNEKTRNGNAEMQMANMESGLIGRETAAANIGQGAVATTKTRYAATFLTQFESLSGREWKILKRRVLYHSYLRPCSNSGPPRDKTLFLTHVGVASILGVFVGGLYFHTGVTIAGFQSRVGCLFFLVGAFISSCIAGLICALLGRARGLFMPERAVQRRRDQTVVPP